MQMCISKLSQAQIYKNTCISVFSVTVINKYYCMAYQSNVVRNVSNVEYGKFVELQGDSRFPAISVTRFTYPDNGAPAVSSVDVYPKYAVISYLANPEDIKVSLSAENINVNLADVETILNVISPDVTTIKNNTDAVETTLTTISNNIGTTNTNVGTINTNVADIEALATTTYQNVTAIHTHVDTIRTRVNTINQNVSAVEALLTTNNTNVGTINTNVADIEALLTRTNTLVNSVSALLGNQLGANGVVFCQPSNGAVAQNFNAVQVLSACKFSAIAIANSTTTGLTNYEFPQNFVLTAPITSLTLSYGAVIAFK